MEGGGYQLEELETYCDFQMLFDSVSSDKIIFKII